MGQDNKVPNLSIILAVHQLAPGPDSSTRPRVVRLPEAGLRELFESLHARPENSITYSISS